MKETVRDRYARHAVELPQTETPPTLGLGDPVELARLKPGETVLDLGSGPGRDLIAAAKIVGSSGRAIGVDFTPEMIDRALHSASEAGLNNVSILEGDLEKLPVPCGAVDVVISNCVINLVGDKRRALVEAFRALRPGGRLAVLDTAFETEPPAEIRNDPDAWCGCIGGSLVLSDYQTILEEIGYENVELRRVNESCGEACSTEQTIESLAVAVTARKPADAHPGTNLRPAVPADRPVIDALLDAERLPTDGLRTQDALVALDGETVVGTIALERYGSDAMLRSLVVAPDHRKSGVGFRLLAGALEVARWSGVEHVHLLTEDAQGFFGKFGFQPVSGTIVREACAESALVANQCCTTATAMRLSFETAGLPMLEGASRKELPTFQSNTCC
jgi:N-acetylglutamate synthase-like GNAT family acetyltransferase/2-polyprenyl-3-methyl-5-hydroxy-6-metoxy-1,4-benzoquinol methylase